MVLFVTDAKRTLVLQAKRRVIKKQLFVTVAKKILVV